MKNGMISTGSKEASESALEILKVGGNAFDAAIAAVLTSMTSEVNLTSLAGGGAMMAYPIGQEPILFDFFVDAPNLENHKNFEFYNINIDFGATSQTFYIGKGSVAIPGNIKGLIHIHKKLGSLPFSIISEPAIEHAKNGVKLSKSQAYITSLLNDIIKTSEYSKRLFIKKDKLISAGQLFKNIDLAETILWLTEEGDRPFYEGEVALRLVKYIGDDGLVSMRGLKDYKVHERKPLHYSILNRNFYTNPLPSVGGILIVFLLRMLYKINSNFEITNDLLIKLMAATTCARFKYLNNPDKLNELKILLEDSVVEQYASAGSDRLLFADEIIDNGLGSTTHVSVLDSKGNAASITTTNGESCGHVLPDTGILLNNMLGEQDLNPLGFHNWTKQRRMATLISPSIILNSTGEVEMVIGSAGSNRIRSAIIQVFINFFNKKMNLEKSINSSRIHLENKMLYLEPNIEIDYNYIDKNVLDINEFSKLNLFFGGVNAVNKNEAVADIRRGGCGIIS